MEGHGQESGVGETFRLGPGGLAIDLTFLRNGTFHKKHTKSVRVPLAAFSFVIGKGLH